MNAREKLNDWAQRIGDIAVRRLPRRVQNILWPRTPWERIRELRAQWNSRTVANQLRSRLQAGPGIVFLPSQTWFSTHFQRPQQLARALASAGMPVVYCEPWSLSHVVSESALAERQFAGVRDLGDRLHLLRWPMGGLRPLFERVEPWALLMSWPWQVPLFSESSSSLVVYEIIDNHELFPNADDYWKKRHAEWVQKADVVVASADDLLAELVPQRPDTLLLPNAVTLEDWQNVSAGEVPADLAAVRRGDRVVAYYGAIANWFDWPLWVHAANARPDWSFVLIGPAYDGNTAAVQARAAAAPNIHYLGPKRYDELPRYMQFVDVATIPFVLNAITHACSPVKLFEYMAAGKPVVTTAMREVLKYHSVLVAHSAEDFVRRLDEAVGKRNDTDYLALLRAEAESNTWHSRAAALAAALQAAAARYGGRPRRATMRKDS